MSIIFAILGILLVGAAAWRLGRLRGYEDRMADELKHSYSSGKYGR